MLINLEIEEDLKKLDRMVKEIEADVSGMGSLLSEEVDKINSRLQKPYYS